MHHMDIDIYNPEDYDVSQHDQDKFTQMSHLLFFRKYTKYMWSNSQDCR